MIKKEPGLQYIFVGDIGGTNANFGLIVQEKAGYRLISSYRQPSQQIANFTESLVQVLKNVIKEHHVSLSAIVIGVAGALCGKQHSVRLTNVPFTIDSAEIRARTGIQDILLVNDFIAVACGYSFVENNMVINAIAIKEQGQKAFIGAGTGLGQSASVWSTQSQSYIPVASEGGHTDFVPHDHFDYELSGFIKARELLQTTLSWEKLLNGRGISHIYEFLGTLLDYPETEISREIAQSLFQPDFISRYAAHDERCKKTFMLYSRYYARFAKQVALQMVPCGGLYISGGIAAKNKALFIDAQFMQEFTDHASHRMLLEKIPIFLIQDYQVSLYGCAHYYTLHTQKIV